jgi:AraC family transcriptional regulator
MDMRWPDGRARDEITCKKAVLWVVAEQVSGRYEHRTDPRESLRSARPGARAMSLVPAGMELWGYAHSIRFVRGLRLTFDLERAGFTLGDRHLGPEFAAPRLMFTSEPVWQIVSLLAGEYRKRSSLDGLYCESIATALCVELLRLGDAGNPQVTRGGLAPWQMRSAPSPMGEKRPSLPSPAAC